MFTDTPIISGDVSRSTPEHTHQRKNCAGPMAERDRNFRIKTASVTVIIVTPHFILSNGNGVVARERVIRLITRY